MSGAAGDVDDFLEDYYDAIVLSTGLGSSILAAALAKAGKSVLYLDCHEYYGQDSASFSFTQLLDWAEANDRKNQGGKGGVADHGGQTCAISTNDAAKMFDNADAWTAIARAHARNELKKEQEMKATAELEGRAGNSDEPGAESTAEWEDIKGQQQGSQDAATAATAATATAAATASAAAAASASEQYSPNTNQPEQQQDDREEEEPTAEETAAEKTAVDAAAAARLQALDLHLLPLSYHGCRTRAGAPSDACVPERERRKVAEDAAAASGRFLGGRQPQPSHPAWAGRRDPTIKRDGGADGGEVEGVHPSFWGYRTERRPGAADLVRLSRSFNLDLTSQVLLATGPAVDALVNSGVASYLEFKDMQALYLASDIAAPASSAAGADVFGTKLLTPLEKRRLMKFLLFASDWGLQRRGEDILSRNEAGLGRGRSLRRPQNREAASGDFDADAHAGKPFSGFLRGCGLPERVRAMITHALALLPGGDEGGEGGGVTTEEGLEAVYRHLSALGRFGETAFIAPLYGVGELSQSFCRMAAVHGAICMLRRQLRGAVVDRNSGRCVGVVDDAGRAFACSFLVVGGEFFAASPPTSTQQPTKTPVPEHLSAPHPPPPPSPETLPTAGTGSSSRVRGRLLRRVVLASGPVAPEGRGRGLCVLPPGLQSIGNPAAVHVVSLDDTTAACPENLGGACVIHLTTTTTRAGEVNDSGQAGVESQGASITQDREGEEEKEVPAGAHANVDGPEDKDGTDGVLGRASKELLAAAGVEEIWSLGFSWDIQDPPRPEDLPANMVVCERPGQELYLHDVVVQAERDFARLFPGEPFWPPPAGQGEDGDDQAEMLEAAASAVTTSGVDANKEGTGGGEQREEGGRGVGEQKVKGGGEAGKQKEGGGGDADREEPGGEHG
ncbi:unnamed protein product, partial [Ectocarpus sp. 13 AM-2016]